MLELVLNLSNLAAALKKLSEVYEVSLHLVAFPLRLSAIPSSLLPPGSHYRRLARPRDLSLCHKRRK